MKVSYFPTQFYSPIGLTRAGAISNKAAADSLDAADQEAKANGAEKYVLREGVFYVGATELPGTRLPTRIDENGALSVLLDGWWITMS